MKNLVRHIGVFGFVIKSLNSCKCFCRDSVILWLIYRLTGYKNHEIIYKSLEYTQVVGKNYIFRDRFWKNQQRKWDPYFSKHECILETDYIPECIESYKLTVKYFYDGKIYKYISKNKVPVIDHQPSTMVVRNPLLKAMQVFRDKHVDVTKRMSRIIGPRGDCHGEKLTCNDVFSSDDDYFILLNTVIKGVIVLKKQEFIPQL